MTASAVGREELGSIEEIGTRTKDGVCKQDPLSSFDDRRAINSAFVMGRAGAWAVLQQGFDDVASYYPALFSENMLARRDGLHGLVL